MKKMFTILMVVAAMMSVSSCTSTSNQENESTTESLTVNQSIIVYGSNTCIHCIQFKAKLDSVGLPYTFNDVDVSDEQALIMVDLIKKSGKNGHIKFPVVYVNAREVLIAPEIEEVLELLN